MTPDRRLLVVVAHPDDETFGCGSVIAHAADRGVDVRVLCATAGEAGEVADGVVIGPGGVAEVRERELRAAAAHLGAGRVDLLGYVDSGMAGLPAPRTLCAAPLEDVAADVARVLDDFRPAVVVTLDAGDGHRDHARVRDATLRAVQRATHPPARVYLHCLARSLMRRWVEHLRAGMPDSAHLDLDPESMGTPDDEVTTVLDTSSHQHRRWEAIRLHASQTSPYEVMPAELRRQFLTADRLRRVVPRWDGGPTEHDLFAEDDGCASRTLRSSTRLGTDNGYMRSGRSWHPLDL